MLKIRSIPRTFRRCGECFTQTFETYSETWFDQEELEILKNEPNLVVVEIREEQAEENTESSQEVETVLDTEFLKIPPMPGTVAKLVEALEGLNVEVPKDAKKADLEVLYQETVDAGIREALTEMGEDFPAEAKGKDLEKIYRLAIADREG